MIVKCLPHGMFDSNCYIIGDKGEGVLIDAGVHSAVVADEVEKLRLKIKYILLTHGHIDHICQVEALKLKTGAQVLIHSEDAVMLTDPQANVSSLIGKDFCTKAADRLLADRDVLEAGGLRFEILHTPGHTAGGICIKVENGLFTGDTLFRMSIGRTDLGNGNYSDLIASIKGKLLTLEEDTVVYPGHNDPSTIGFEKRYNEFLNNAMQS